MKAIKNKKRFDPRRFLSERKEETKENVEKTNANYNSFSLDNWLEEEVVSEYVLDLDPDRDNKEERPAPPLASRQPGLTVKIRSQEDQDDILKNLSNDVITRDELTTSMEEACGGPEMGPEEAQPAIADLSPDEAFGAGWSAAVEEIMASVQGLLDDPMDMSVGPEEEESALVVTQLPEAEEHEDGRSTDLIKTLEKEWNKSMNKVKSSSVDNDADYLLNVIRGVGDLGAGREIPVDDYIESLDEEDIDALIDRFQNEKETLKSQKPHVYKLIMAIISKRASAPRSRDGEAEDRRMDFRDDAIGDYPGSVEGWKLEES